MIFKIRVILDTKEDVIRTLLIDSTNTLEDLHKAISTNFGFDGLEMASFYRADDAWEQGEEIPLFSMDDSPEALCMSNTTIEQNIEDINEKLIYVYDFMSMWTFYCELIEILPTTEHDLPKLVFSIGDMPAEAPEKSFIADDTLINSYDFDDDIDEDFNDGFNDDDFNEFDSEFNDYGYDEY